VQVTLQAGVPQPILNSSSISAVPEDDIDAALEDLQVTLEGSNISSGHNDIMQIPELSDYLRFLKYVLTLSDPMSDLI
jgi:kindlin 2